MFSSQNFEIIVQITSLSTNVQVASCAFIWVRCYVFCSSWLCNFLLHCLWVVFEASTRWKRSMNDSKEERKMMVLQRFRSELRRTFASKQLTSNEKGRCKVMNCKKRSIWLKWKRMTQHSWTFVLKLVIWTMISNFCGLNMLLHWICYSTCYHLHEKSNFQMEAKLTWQENRLF